MCVRVGIGTSHGVALVDYFQKQSVLVKCTVEEGAFIVCQYMWPSISSWYN